MKRSEHRILTTHVGSLIRPPELLEFATARQQGQPIDEQAYAECLRRGERGSCQLCGTVFASGFRAARCVC